MRFSAETTADGVTERLFTVGDVPALYGRRPGPRGRARWCCSGMEAPGTGRRRRWRAAPAAT